MSAVRWWAGTKEQVHEAGRTEGRLEGRLEALAHIARRRLTRGLTEQERDLLRAKLDRLGLERVEDAVLDMDRAALSRWLTDPTAN